MIKASFCDLNRGVDGGCGIERFEGFLRREKFPVDFGMRKVV